MNKEYLNDLYYMEAYIKLLQTLTVPNPYYAKRLRELAEKVDRQLNEDHNEA